MPLRPGSTMRQGLMKCWLLLVMTTGARIHNRAGGLSASDIQGREWIEMKIRKIVTTVEDTHIEIGQTISPPTRRAAAIAVIENPFAGRYQEDLEELMGSG